MKLGRQEWLIVLTILVLLTAGVGVGHFITEVMKINHAVQEAGSAWEDFDRATEEYNLSLARATTVTAPSKKETVLGSKPMSEMEEQGKAVQDLKEKQEHLRETMDQAKEKSKKVFRLLGAK